jgi:hypothetical protein
MHNVPTEDPLGSFMATWPTVYPWRRMKHKVISHCAFTIDDFRLPTLDHWQTVLVNAGVNALLSRRTSPSARIRP